jgi:hypothetical protein
MSADLNVELSKSDEDYYRLVKGAIERQSINVTSNVLHLEKLQLSKGITHLKLLCGVCILVGIPFLVVLIGIVPILGGFFGLFKASKEKARVDWVFDRYASELGLEDFR